MIAALRNTACLDATGSANIREDHVPRYQAGRVAGRIAGGDTGLEPGDLSKLMAIPWHTDYNSCSLHLPNPNLEGNITLFWSWPAQRPVAVYAAKDVKNRNLGHQRFSVRGVGTSTTDPGQLGVFQNRIDMVTNWHKIGVIMQGTAIDTDGALSMRTNTWRPKANCKTAGTWWNLGRSSNSTQ